MRETKIVFHGYTIEVPDGLLRDFETLSMFMKHLEFENLIDLMYNPVIGESLMRCSCATMAAIGQNYAHDLGVRHALNAWMQLSEIEQGMAILVAAKNTDPLDCSHIFLPAQRLEGE